MIQLNSTGKILDDVPRNSTMRLSAIVKGYLITKFPNAIQNRLNKIDNNRTIPRNTGHETKKENRNAIWNKRPRRGQKRREQRNKESPNKLHAQTIQKTMIDCLPARTGCRFIRRNVAPIAHRLTNLIGFEGYEPREILSRELKPNAPPYLRQNGGGGRKLFFTIRDLSPTGIINRTNKIPVKPFMAKLKEKTRRLLTLLNPFWLTTNLNAV